MSRNENIVQELSWCQTCINLKMSPSDGDDEVITDGFASIKLNFWKFSAFPHLKEWNFVIMAIPDCYYTAVRLLPTNISQNLPVTTGRRLLIHKGHLLQLVSWVLSFGFLMLQKGSKRLTSLKELMRWMRKTVTSLDQVLMFSTPEQKESIIFVSLR